PVAAIPIAAATSSGTAAGSSGFWDKVSDWASRNKALIYSIAGAAVVVTGAGAVYYLRSGGGEGERGAAAAASTAEGTGAASKKKKKRSKTQRRKEKKKGASGSGEEDNQQEEEGSKAAGPGDGGCQASPTAVCASSADSIPRPAAKKDDLAVRLLDWIFG
ncbi:hypothetical protein KEM52_005167, partial [Ascosphaera acerosa]